MCCYLGAETVYCRFILLLIQFIMIFAGDKKEKRKKGTKDDDIFFVAPYSANICGIFEYGMRLGNR